MNILGIMSGTSCDGLDLCNVKIDLNKDYNFNYEILNFFTIPFSDIEKNFIFSLRNHENYTNKENEIELTNIFINKIKKFCSNLNQIDYIACHGQTVLHIDKKISIQLFDAKYCFEKLDIPIIYNFRNNDIKYGGTGAPLMPFLDWLLFSNKSEDIVTLNMTTGKYTAYDVKSKNYRKKDYVPKDGYKRNSTGSLINRHPTKEQKKLKVKIIYATI